MEDLRKVVAIGRDAYNNRDYKIAEKYLKSALKERDDLADVHNMLGVIYSQTGRIEIAKESFERAIIINPGYTDAALNLSVTYNELGKYDEARKVYTRAMRASRNQETVLDPFVKGKLANMHADIGEAYRELGLFEDALEEYSKSLKLAPAFIDIRTRMAEIYREMGKPELALDELNAVIEKNSNYVPALIAIGVVYFSDGQYSKSKSFFNKVKELAPSNRSCSLYLKMIDLHENNNSENSENSQKSSDTEEKDQFDEATQPIPEDK